MIQAQDFLVEAAERGFRLFSGVPCSFLKPLINHTIDSQAIRYVGAANEGDAVAIASGAELGGLRGVAMFQNSGLGNAVSPLTSLTYTFRIPILIVVTHRGDPEGKPDEPQHELMGRITGSLLELMDIPWEKFPDEESRIGETLERACDHMRDTGRPYALVLGRGSVEPRELEGASSARKNLLRATVESGPDPTRTRVEFLNALRAACGATDVLLATTGYTGRELLRCGDRANQFYMVGSMGCISSLALGLAIARPERRVVAIDGDGAALMRLSAMPTIGHERPANLVHVLLDNGVHESTGGQATVSRSMDFCAIAAACGYARSERLTSPDELADFLAADVTGPSFAHIAVLPGTTPDLPRPVITPDETAGRLRAFLESN